MGIRLMEYKIKHLHGKNPTVFYRCATCGGNLQSPLGDAGTEDSCPDCNARFMVPGQKEWEERRASEAEENRLAQEMRWKKYATERKIAEELREKQKQRQQQAIKQMKSQGGEIAAELQGKNDEPASFVDEVLQYNTPRSQSQNSPVSRERDEGNYDALHLLSLIYTFGAWITGVSGVIGIIYGISMLDDRRGSAGFIVIAICLVSGFIATATMLAIAEGIQLAIDLKSDTNKMCALLKQLLDKAE